MTGMTHRMRIAPTLPILFFLLLASGHGRTVAKEQAGLFAQAANERVDGKSTLTFATGATRIVEIHGDWTLNCEIIRNAKTCVVVQARGDRGMHALALTLHVRAIDGDRAKLVFTVPPGLPQSATAALELDGKSFVAEHPFDACTEKSCVATFLVEAEPFAALRLGHTLKMAITVPNGRQIDRPVTLKGFATAIQRGIELSD